VTFDLHRRLYAGVSWTPALRRAAGERDLGRAAFDVGVLEIEGNTGTAQAGFRHRLRLVEGVIELAPFGADLTLLRYDLSRARADPLVRLTTFFGTPRRHDIDAHLGGWFELGHVQAGEVAPGREETLWRYATAHLTWDVWRTREMDSFVRLRGGLGLERAREEGRPEREALTWAVAAEGDLTIGVSGLDRLTFLAQIERPTFIARDDEEGPDARAARRAAVRGGYERVVVAVNDQPVTLRLAGEAAYRSDVPDLPAGWDLRLLLGLRFNLWAPARQEGRGRAAAGAWRRRPRRSPAAAPRRAPRRAAWPAGRAIRSPPASIPAGGSSSAPARSARPGKAASAARSTSPPWRA